MTHSETHQFEASDDLCPVCHQRVFFNERGPPFLTKLYHDRCFKLRCQHIDVPDYIFINIVCNFIVFKRIMTMINAKMNIMIVFYIDI